MTLGQLGEPPEVGSIVWCWFPYTTRPTATSLRAASSERHPCFVLSKTIAESGEVFLTVAGGTSLLNKNQTTRPIRETDLVCRVGDNGFKPMSLGDAANPGKLLGSTKFSMDFDDILCLPYTDQYFYAPPTMSGPVVGKVDLRTEVFKERLKTIFAAADIKKSIELREKEALKAVHPVKGDDLPST